MAATGYALLIVLMPLAGFVVLGLAGRHHLKRSAGWLATALMSVSAAAALLLAWHYFFVQNALGRSLEPAEVFRFRWLSFSPSLYVDMGMHLDGLSVMMLVLVSTVSLLVHLYSVEYLRSEERYTSYFAFLQLFTFSMLGLVVSVNLFQIYFFWELVGVSSYLLIGFHYERPSAVSAAKKAFVVTRFADFGFLIGILIVGFSSTSFDLNTLFQTNCHVDAAREELFLGMSAITWGTLLMFMGGAGKSAMFPLHIWLPDAMEGPTPVSALIHAATMVVAGVFLVARLFPLYEVAWLTADVVTVIGLTSSLLAAIIACTQTDIKRVLAYSTMSQIGLMLFGLGLAAQGASREAGYVGSQFHLFTHGFFKALLFLAAGVVIHRVHSNEVSDMGGLRRTLPLTHLVFLIACLAISGIPPLSGFFSKETILLAAASHPFWYGLALLVSALTAFYMFRLYFLTFWNKPALPKSEPELPTASERLAYGFPLVVLAVATAVNGFIPFGLFVAPDGRPYPVHASAAAWLPPVGAALCGIAVAAWGYARASERPQELARRFGAFYSVAYRKFYIDELYAYITRRIIFGKVGRSAAWTDRQVVDGAVNQAGWLIQQWSLLMKCWQSGRLQGYAFWFFVGAGLLAVVLLLYSPN
ncbi:MAG: NADH-quinone oxidoreductase subunit L [Chitinophagales bacterium]|nr:NADH-quinone oxidoreductase subunit L [Chitinophagales bacterium]